MVCFVEYPNNFSEQFPALYQKRYCDPENFSMAVFGVETNNTNELKINLCW